MSETASSELPAGWRIEREFEDTSGYVDVIYVVYKWSTWSRRRFLRKPVERTGWGRVYSSRWRDSAAQYVLDTVTAMEAEK